MTGRLRAIRGHVDAPLPSGWQVAALPPGAAEDPAGLARAAPEWVEATVPSTAASALRAAGLWSLDHPARRFDAEDWWWRVTFPGSVAGEAEPGDEVVLCLDGVATVADVWLDGAPLATLEGMFLPRELPITLAREHELVIRCRSLDALLAARRPRPRWRAPMIENAQLRWFRTTLLGRTPGWSPPAAAVGPWRPVRIERRRGVAIDEVHVRATIDGDAGVLEVRARVRELGARTERASLVVARGGREHRADLVRDGAWLAGRVIVPHVARWWPHTHGEPARYAARLEIEAARSIVVDLGDVGFRTVAAVTDDGGFTVHVNGARVFCRGACWTPLDPVSLAADDAALDTAMAQVAGAGMNMLRVGGTMVYESDRFLDAADAAGILLWQDLMFANMDYPEDDAAFAASVTAEVRAQLARLEGRPSVAVVCGNSEGEQQAAMFGASRDRWSPRLFHDTFAMLSRELLPDVPYWPSSAHGGAFPHQADRGTTSYYGVGAYLRPLDDARRADVRFASECLAFANVPAPRTIERMPGGASIRVHHPAWKARTPRDLGAGWDFDDVRDHYVARMFGVDPASVRYADHERYLELGRVAAGEVMARTFGEWRRAGSRTGGALVWFLRDLWPGAGWGIVGSDGLPKSVFHYLRRALAPVAMHVSDEGGNGLFVHAVNDRAEAIDGELAIALYRGDVCVGRGAAPLAVAARSAVVTPAIALLDGFLDLNHAYRFGPPSCDLVVATLRAHGATLAESFFFPLGLPSTRTDVGLTAELAARGDGDLDLTVGTRGHAHAVTVTLDGFVADDDFFHLAPGASRTLRLRRDPGASPARRGSVAACNALTTTAIQVPA